MEFVYCICLIFICCFISAKQMIWLEQLLGLKFNRKKQQYIEISEKLKKRTIKKIVISIPVSAIFYIATIVKIMMICLIISQHSH